VVEKEHSFEFDQAPELDRGVIVEKLKELGVDVEIEDFLDEDDNDVLGIIATYAYMYDGDIDQFFAYLDVPVALRRDP
jgi:hypothetical protein